MNSLKDKYRRTHDYLRISLTDKCNLNCSYCSPSQSGGIKNNRILTYDELHRLIKIFINELGIMKIRFTGGEPLVRKDITLFFDLISEECRKNNVKLGITTNGILLSENLHKLKKAGIEFINISLDSLDNGIFSLITGANKLNTVLDSINNACNTGFDKIKINCVVLRNKNYKEIFDFIEFVKYRKIDVRFIEYMPFDNNSWNETEYVGTEELLYKIKAYYELINTDKEHSSTSRSYNIPGYKGSISFISPMSDNFCNDCNRLRITSDGKLKLCLFSTKTEDIDMMSLLRDENCTDDELTNLLISSLQNKKASHPGIEVLTELKRDNMISIGG